MADEALLSSSPRNVAQVEVYRSDVVVRRTLRHKSYLKSGGKRGEVKTLSHRSRSRLIFTLRNFPHDLPVMITLTYPGEFPSDGKAVKRHLDTFIKFLKRQGVRAGVWWMEFQKRGAPHYHMFVANQVDKDALSEAWYRIVNSGDPRHLRAGTRVEAVRNRDNGVSYAWTYAKKAEQKQVPPEYQSVGRMWGYWGCHGKLKPELSAIDYASRIAPLVRIARKLKEQADSRFHDRGWRGFTAYGAGNALRQVADRIYIDGVAWTVQDVLQHRHTSEKEQQP